MYQRLCTSSFNIIHEEINYIWIITVKYKALCYYKPCHFIIILIIIMIFVTTLTCLWRQRNFKKWLLGHWVFICPCVQHSIINAQLLNNFCFLCIICLEWLYQKERVAWGYDYTVYKSYLCPTHDQHPVLPRHKKEKTPQESIGNATRSFNLTFMRKMHNREHKRIQSCLQPQRTKYFM